MSKKDYEIFTWEQAKEAGLSTKQHVDEFILYGMGQVGINYLKNLIEMDIHPVAICDSDVRKQGTSINNYTVKSLREVLDKQKDFSIIITSLKFYDEIRVELLEFLSPEKILDMNSTNIELLYSNTNKAKALIYREKQNFLNLRNILEDEKSKEVLDCLLKARTSNDFNIYKQINDKNQYFPNFLNLNKFEVFVDCGAYTGDTIEQFIMITNNQFKKIYAFEPFTDSFNCLQNMVNNKFKNDGRIISFNKGVYSKNDIIHFKADEISKGSSHICGKEESNTSIEAVSLDSCLNDIPTFIKMDIEGSELEALKGTEKLIRQYKPKLAICIYHQLEHFYKIPEYIHSLNLGYKYYIRHHGSSPYSICETVFYAI